MKKSKNRYTTYKSDLFESTMHLVNKGFLQGTGGNVSMRIEGDEIIAITPSQVEYSIIKPDDICIIDFDQNPVVPNKYKPSIEIAMHISIYKNRLDVNSVIHTHQIFATIFSIINHPIPALFDEVSMNIGYTVDIIPYALAGSTQLAENVTKKLENLCNCYIIQNHGALSLGTDIRQAVRNAELLEKCAQVYYYALTTGKTVTPLPQDIADNLFKQLIEKQNNIIK